MCSSEAAPGECSGSRLAIDRFRAPGKPKISETGGASFAL